MVVAKSDLKQCHISDFDYEAELTSMSIALRGATSVPHHQQERSYGPQLTKGVLLVYII